MTAMAGKSRKQRLQAMLDVDLEHADAASKSIGDDGVDDGADQHPTTFSEWFQVASAEDLRSCLKSLMADHEDASTLVRDMLAEERAHQDWVVREEKQWKEQQKPALATEAEEMSVAEVADELRDLEQQCRFIPLRLTADERSLLVILQGALYVSEYTDRVDVYHAGNKAHRMALQIQQVCAILAGLIVANNYDVARRPLMEHDFAESKHFFRAMFEIGRRYKILSPDKLRGSYGKLIHMLQDSVKEEVVRAVGFECVAQVKTVGQMLRQKKLGPQLLRDPLLVTATKEIYEVGKAREAVAREVQQKAEAFAELKRRYTEASENGTSKPKPAGDLCELLKGSQTESPTMTQDNVETIVASIADHFAFQRFNREPCDRMIEFLKQNFNPSNDREWSLEISRGRAGSCLTHSHRTQFQFVFQSLLLWREIMSNMFALWQGTEADLLDPQLRYRLCDTGQGLNRMQSAPTVSQMMKQILHRVQNEVGGWVGLSVVHLGDRDVPNALIFIDKYTQVPRILAPIVACLDKLPEVYASSAATKKLIDSEFKGLDTLRMTILQDFFRHGFDGSGDDGGSCVDGRLTSCWNWCSKIEKKPYFTALLLTGFTGFDGGFESGAGW